MWFAREKFKRTWKVGEKSGNLKINGDGSLQKYIYIYMYSVHLGKDLLSRESKPISSSLGVLLKEKNLLLGEQIFFFKSNPQFCSDMVSTILVKNKDDFFRSVRGFGKL